MEQQSGLRVQRSRRAFAFASWRSASNASRALARNGRTRKLTGRVALAATALIASACAAGGDDVPLAGAGGGGGGGGDDVIIFGGNGPVGPGFDPGDYSPPTAGTPVARFETVATDSQFFLLRGTLPLPAGALTDTNATSPYAVLDWDGAVAWTQLEKVSRYPTAAQGFDVVELIAKVELPPDTSAGDRITYDVVQVGDGTPLTHPSNTANSVLLQETAGLPSVVSDLVNDPTSIMITSRDVFGHTYAQFPLEPTNARELRKYGPMQTELRTFGMMEPIAPVAGNSGTLPHMWGVHSYVSTLQGEPVVRLDLRFNNGVIDTTADSNDDPLGKFYFDEIAVQVPPGWSVVQEYVDPGMGTVTTGGGYVKHQIVGELPGGKLHVFPSQGQMVRRLAICPNTVTDRARQILEEEGRAFCKRGTDSGSGNEYYSWWNESTARYFPQNFPLPSLEHNGLSTIRSRLVDDFNEYHGYFSTGTGNGNWPVKDARLGWAHPWGVSYGGMTGGVEIHIFDGIRTAEAASIEGYRSFELHHRMLHDRHPVALYKSDGAPVRIDDVLVPASPEPYMPLSLFIGPTSGDHFGFNNASPDFQRDAVAAQNKQPDYEGTLLGYGYILGTHLIRATRSSKVLAWLGNDSLAKDDLFMQAELARMTHHRYPVNTNGAMSGSSMRYDMWYTAAYPNNGYEFQRHEGWYADTMAAAYAMQAPSWRTAAKPWFEDFVATAAAGQVTCSGLLYAKVNNKVLDAKYRGAQAYETAIANNALVGTLETVLRGADPTNTALLSDVLTNFYQGFVSTQAWNYALEAPYTMYAMGPTDDNADVWCSGSQIPSDGFSSSVSRYQTPSTLGYAYWHTGDEYFLYRAAAMYGGSDPLTEMEGQYLQNPENEAAALSAAQRWAGVL